MEQPLFHVMVGGRKVGPHDRRAIVGMRIRGALTSQDVLIDGDGMQLTVADLIGRVARAQDFNPNRSGAYSVVKASYPASLTSVEGQGPDILRFKGEVAVRVQADAVRIAGRFRKGLGWKEGRIKLPIAQIVHAGARGSQVDLGLGPGGDVRLQRVVLELFTADAASEMVQWLPQAQPWPEVAVPHAGPVRSEQNRFLLWVPVLGVVTVVVVVLAVLMSRRMY